MKRSFGIDLIRSLSILIVMFRHYRVTDGFNFGFYAIEFLFVVSGYLIGQILLKEFYRTDQVTLHSVGRFMMRRWFRILPMYYLAIFLKFIFMPDIGWNVLYYVFFLQNHFYGIDFYPVTWSLVIDEWFYLGTPLMLYVFMKLFGSAKVRVLAFLVFVVACINLLRFFWVQYTDAGFETLVGNVPFRQDTLLIGVIAAFIKIHYRPIFDWLNAKSKFMVVFTLFIGYVFLMYLIRGDESNSAEDHIDDFIWTRTVNFSLCALIIAATLPFFENSVEAFKHRLLQPLNYLVVTGSKISYALYLFHLEVLQAFTWLFPDVAEIRWLRNVLCMLIAVLLSYWLYQIVEKKFLILRDKYYPDIPSKKTA
jgi:peptidoglycan/LPS O-acetylase OafA/YrhL